MILDSGYLKCCDNRWKWHKSTSTNLIANYLLKWRCPQIRLMFWLMRKLSKTESTQHSFLCCFALYLLVAYWQTKKAGFCNKIAKDLQMTLWRSTSFAVLEFCQQFAYKAKLANKRKVYNSRIPLAHGCSMSAACMATILLLSSKF